MPASNAKLFTTALALATLGPDYRVRTTVASSGALDANGVLNGDLVLIGRGDANLSNRKFPYGKKEERDGPPEKVLADFADAVAARGVKEITGDVVADDSMFQHEIFPSGWLVDDILWSYGAAVSAIAVNDNIFTLDRAAGRTRGRSGAVTIAGSRPISTPSKIRSSLRARGSEEKLAVARDPGSRLIHLSGTMPLDAQTRRLTIAIEEPAEYAASLLARLLRSPRSENRWTSARAPHCRRRAVDAAAPQTVLAEHASVPLSDEIRLTNKNSENLHAELLLLLAAHEKAGARNYEDALKFASDFFRTAGIADGDVVLSDGSGLSRKDLVTPRAVVQLLALCRDAALGRAVPLHAARGRRRRHALGPHEKYARGRAHLRKNGNHRTRQHALGLRDDRSRRAALVFDPRKQQQSSRAGRQQSHRCDLRGDGRGVGARREKEVEEIEEVQEVKENRVASGLSSTATLGCAGFAIVVVAANSSLRRAAKLAQPRVAVLLRTFRHPCESRLQPRHSVAETIAGL